MPSSHGQRAEVGGHHQPADALGPLRPQVGALGVLERLLPGVLGAGQRPDQRSLDAAEQVPRLRESERVAELLGGAEHLVDVVEQPVAVAAEHAQ